MNRTASASFWTIVFGLILLVSTGSVSAQKAVGPIGPLWEDTAMNPHDYSNEYFEANGIAVKAILDRRTGSDGLSIFGNSSNPIHSNVRVIATMPAYGADGEILFWYPLGEFSDYAFIDGKPGARAREAAKLFQLYVFPHSKLRDSRTYATTRQAALIASDAPMPSDQQMDINPLGLREIVFVTFTEKAFTEDGAELMAYMEKKNGMSADDTPIMNTIEDLRVMMKFELISTVPPKGVVEQYAIAPTISDPTNGVIAQDAYLWHATIDGTPLPTEQAFAWQFTCLQKTGNWCK